MPAGKSRGKPRGGSKTRGNCAPRGGGGRDRSTFLTTVDSHAPASAIDQFSRASSTSDQTGSEGTG